MIKRYSSFQNCIYVLKDCLVYTPVVIVLAVFLAVASSAAAVSGTYIPAMIVKGLEENWGMERIIWVVAMLALAVAALNLLNMVCQALYSAQKSKCRQQFILYLDQKVMNIDYQYLEKAETQVKINQAADLLYTSSDAVGIHEIHEGMKDLLSVALGITACAVLLKQLHFGMVLFVFVISMCNAVLNLLDVHYQQTHRDAWAKADKKIQYINRKLTEKDYGMDIRAFGCVGWLMSKLDDAIRERGRWFERICGHSSQIGGIQAAVNLVYHGGVIGYVIWAIISGRIAASDFVLYMGLITQLAVFNSQLFSACNRLIAGGRDVQVIREFLEWKGRTGRQEDLVEKMGSQPIEIRFEHVTFCYRPDEKAILSDFNLTIHPGEKIALIGANGAGKSTLIKLLCGLYEPTEGQIFLNNIPISEYAQECVWKLFSVVFQDFVIMPLPIAQNVAMALPEDIDHNRVKKYIDQVGLKEKLLDTSVPLIKEASEEGIDLSGGQIQRLLIARAMYKDAPVFLLDEPTAALDPLAESRLYDQYNEMVKGKTSIFVSHRLASTKFCDRILFLDNGKIAEAGTHDQLLSKNGKYAEMFRTQSKYYS